MRFSMVSHVYYNLTTSELHTNTCLLYDAYTLMLRTKTNLKTDQEKFIRSNALTASPRISVRPVSKRTRTSYQKE